MFGVVSFSLQPKTPMESQLMSSTVMMRTFGFAAAKAEVAQTKKVMRARRREAGMAR
jgi:hypothetical protein